MAASLGTGPPDTHRHDRCQRRRDDSGRCLSRSGIAVLIFCGEAYRVALPRADRRLAPTRTSRADRNLLRKFAPLYLPL